MIHNFNDDGFDSLVLAEALHGGRHQQRADDGGLDDDGDGQPHTELLHGEDLTGGEPGEAHDDECGGRGDDPARALEPDGDGRLVVAGLVVHLLDAGE